MTNPAPDAEAAAPAPPPPPTPQSRVLERDTEHGMLGGVAAGVANYLEADPTLIRLMFALIAIVSGGFAVVAYVIAWLLLPVHGTGKAIISSGPSTASSAGHRGDGGVVGGLILLFIGGVWLFRNMTGISIDAGIAMSCGLIAVGVLLIVAGGRVAPGGLIGLGIVLSIVLAMTLPMHRMMQYQSGFGDRDEGPRTTSEIQSPYTHAFGSMTIDLRRLELPAGTTAIEANTSFGSLHVILPAGVPARVHGNASFGSIRALGQQTDGVSPAFAAQSDNYESADKRIDVNITAAFGSAEVLR